MKYPIALAIITDGIGQHRPMEVFDVIDEVRGFNWTQFIWLRKPADEESEWINVLASTKKYVSVHHAYRQ